MSASSSPSTSTKDGGRLFVCGRTGGKGPGGLSPCHPVSSKVVDNHGHSSFPQQLIVSDKDVRFSHVKGEHIAMSAALESSPNPGGLWCWTSDSAQVQNVIPKGVVSFAVGCSYALAAMQDGSLLIVGSHPHIDREEGSTMSMKPRPFKVKPPKGVTCVSASEETIAIVCGDEGEVWTIGPHAIANGHGESLTTEWKRIQLGGGSSISSSTTTTATSTNSNDSGISSNSKAPLIKAISVGQGSLTGGCVTACGKIFLWGDGISGTLGTGTRTKSSPKSVAICHDFPSQFNDPAVQVSCTTSQLLPKRNGTKTSSCGPGQEGGRTHVVTKSGSVYVCGTTHKGLGANCLYKTLGQDEDLLTFYKVGTQAMDWKSQTKCPTGGAEDLARKEAAAPEVIARRIGMDSVELFGKDRNTNYLTEAGLKIISSQPTHIHSCAVSADGRVFTWGCGSDGRTGLRAFLRGPSGSKRLMKCYISTPSVVEELEDKKVLDACACRNYTLFVVA